MVGQHVPRPARLVDWIWDKSVFVRFRRPKIKTINWQVESSTRETTTMPPDHHLQTRPQTVAGRPDISSHASTHRQVNCRRTQARRRNSSMLMLCLPSTRSCGGWLGWLDSGSRPERGGPAASPHPFLPPWRPPKRSTPTAKRVGSRARYQCLPTTRGR